MDLCAHRVANALVGNDADAASLEITLLGPELAFEDERLAAIAGAQFDVDVDDRPAPWNAAFLIPSGARLRFRGRRQGVRAYLAIAGGLDCASVLGSRSTHVVSAMGGLDGRALKAGDRVPLGDRSATRRAAPALEAPIVALPRGEAMVRVLPGPQLDYFAPEALATLQSGPYVIAQNSDRMGFRLAGPRIVHARGADIISDATPLGVLQVPASGQPILLMADRQTAGGYPKLATVITADMAVAGQLGPGDSIRFAVCSAREAMAALIVQERALMALELGQS
jgi:biotin-dependent carboxylase-like uncharacterized protein